MYTIQHNLRCPLKVRVAEHVYRLVERYPQTNAERSKLFAALRARRRYYAKLDQERREG